MAEAFHKLSRFAVEALDRATICQSLTSYPSIHEGTAEAGFPLCKCHARNGGRNDHRLRSRQH
jgi:hypothetical protein